MTAGTFKYYNFYANSLDLNKNIIGKYALEIEVNPISGDPDSLSAKCINENNFIVSKTKEIISSFYDK